MYYIQLVLHMLRGDFEMNLQGCMFASYILQEFDASILVTTPSVPYKGWSLITQTCTVPQLVEVVG